MSPGAVEERLAEMARLYAQRRRRIDVDMSPAAVEGRLRRVAELRRLCLGLAAACRITDSS